MIKTVDIEDTYSALKAKQMDVVMGIVSVRDDFTTLRDMGKVLL